MELLKVIKFEGDDDTLVWKHPDEDFNTQSQLIVHESQEAILFRDGQALDSFGPGRYTLETQNIPLLRGLINLPTEGESPFHCEVYFINKAYALNLQWGTSSRFQVLDPTFEVPLSVGASGSMEFVVEDSRKFLIKVVGTQRIVTADKLLFYFREKTVTKVKSYLSTIMSEVSYLTINQHLEEISEALLEKLNEDYSFYGIKLINFYVSTIIIPNEDTERIKEALNRKMEYGTLDYNWRDEQIVEISKRYASNPGSQDNPGSMVAQIPIAMAFGEMLKNNMGNSFGSQLSGQAMAFGSSESNSSQSSKSNIVENSVDGSNQSGQSTVLGASVNSNATNKIFCTKCGHELPEGSNFCNKCGQKIENGLACPKCGFNISSNDNFCLNCGNKLK